MPNTDGASWDEAKPVITDPRRAGALEIQSLRLGVGDRLGKEHTAPAAAGVGGEHTAGSAKAYHQASAPTLRPDGATSLDSTDAGRLWIDSDDDVLYKWNGTAWEAVVANDPSPSIYQFEKTDGGASPTIPLTQSGLTPGTYIVWVEGTVEGGFTGSASFTVSLTVNGVTRTIVIDNAPDGSAPFSVALHVTVTGAGTCSLTAASNVDRIMKMHGFLTVAS